MGVLKRKRHIKLINFAYANFTLLLYGRLLAFSEEHVAFMDANVFKASLNQLMGFLLRLVFPLLVCILYVLCLKVKVGCREMYERATPSEILKELLPLVWRKGRGGEKE